MLFVLIIVVILIGLSPTQKRLNQWVGLILAVFLGYCTLTHSLIFNQLLFFETDLSEYCIAIKEMRSDWWSGDMPPKRTRLAASIPTLLSFVFPILDALSLSSIIFTVLTFIFVYVWATSLIDSTVGVCSICIMSLMTPMVMMPRFLTFYPPIVCVTVFAACSLTLWGRYRTWWSAMLCGFGIGLCLVVDVRGVLWAVPYWIGAICLVFSMKKIRQQIVSLLALHCPIWISWFVGWWSYHFNSSSLEKQIDVRPLYVGFDESNPLYQPPWIVESNFIWGRTSPSQFWETLQFIFTQKQYPVPLEFLTWQNGKSDAEQYLLHWEHVLLVCIPLCIFTLWKNKWKYSIIERMLLFVCSIVPFVVLFFSLSDLVEQHIRFYMHVFPGIAIIIAVASGAFLNIFEKQSFLSKPWYSVLWYTGMLSIVFVGLRWSGSSVHPDAEWRNKWVMSAHEYNNMQRGAFRGGEQSYQSDCSVILEDEGWKPTVYP